MARSPCGARLDVEETARRGANRKGNAMRTLKILAVFVLAIAWTGASMAEDVAKLSVGTHNVRGDVVIDTDTAVGDTVAYELGYSVFCDENYELALVLLVQDDRDVERQGISFSIEQNLPTGLPLIPYLGASVGYGWIDTNDDNPEEDGVFARATAGLKLFLRPNLAATASAHYSVALANDQLFLDDSSTGLDDKNLEFAFGLRVYF